MWQTGRGPWRIPHHHVTYNFQGNGRGEEGIPNCEQWISYADFFKIHITDRPSRNIQCASLKYKIGVLTGSCWKDARWTRMIIRLQVLSCRLNAVFATRRLPFETKAAKFKKEAKIHAVGRSKSLRSITTRPQKNNSIPVKPDQLRNDG